MKGSWDLDESLNCHSLLHVILKNAFIILLVVYPSNGEGRKKKRPGMKKFRKTYIEITNICNLSCEFCPKTGREARRMDRALFEEILRKLEGYAKHLYFHVMGEPLLHPEIGVFLDLCHISGYRVHITTNGTLIEQAADSLISKPALRQLNFSLHSFSANDNALSGDDYLEKIFCFIRRVKEEELLIHLRLWNLQEDGGSAGNQYVLQRIAQEFGTGAFSEEQLIPGNSIKLSEKVYLNQAARFEWPDMKRGVESGKAFCYGLRDQIAILSDGTVVPCCLDSEGMLNLGNISKQDLKDILTGERARKIYEGFSRREAVEELCKRCGYRTRFHA